LVAAGPGLVALGFPTRVQGLAVVSSCSCVDHRCRRVTPCEPVRLAGEAVRVVVLLFRQERGRSFVVCVPLPFLSSRHRLPPVPSCAHCFVKQRNYERIFPKTHYRSRGFSAACMWGPSSCRCLYLRQKTLQILVLYCTVSEMLTTPRDHHHLRCVLKEETSDRVASHTQPMFLLAKALT